MSLLCGTQLLTLFCCLFILAFLGVLYPYNRGTLLTSLVIIYTLTSAVAGYNSASFYGQFVETGWVWVSSTFCHKEMCKRDSIASLVQKDTWSNVFGWSSTFQCHCC